MENEYEKIVAKHPELFSNGNTIELNQTGWFKIIENLCWAIDFEMKRLPEEVALGIFVVQCKSKFGGLRFYMSHDTPYIEGAIWVAEAISLSTCEACGDRGSSFTIGGWTSTFCEKHANEERARVKEFERKQTEEDLDENPIL